MFRRAIISMLTLGSICGMPSSMEAAEPAESSLVYIEAGYMENGTFKRLEEGTGFIIHPSGWVVTAKHVSEAVVPPGKIRYLRGAVKSNTATPFQLFATAVPVVSADIALLRFSSNLRTDWPFLKIKANHAFNRRDNITAYGFPIGSDLWVRPGVVSDLMGPMGSIGVNAGLAPGMSGGPVLLGNSRCVVGVVAGGSGYPNYDYFTPTQYAKPLLDVPPAEFASEITAPGDGGGPAQAPLFDRSYRVDETYDDHKADKSSKTYSLDFQADTGAKIVSVRMVEESAAAANDKAVNIQGDRTKATFKFRLESGPFFDRWRGWWHGQVVLTQQQEVQQPQARASCD